MSLPKEEAWLGQVHGRLWGREGTCLRLAAGAPRVAGSLDPHPVGHAGTCPVLSRARPPSVVLLLALHLCVFTMLGMLLFTGDKVPTSAALLGLMAGWALC